MCFNYLKNTIKDIPICETPVIPTNDFEHCHDNNKKNHNELK